MVAILLTTGEFSIEMEGGDSLRFRVEIFEIDPPQSLPSKFVARVWRYEAFRLLIPSSVSSDELYDHTVLVQDDQFDGMELRAETAAVALRQCISAILRQSRAE